MEYFPIEFPRLGNVLITERAQREFPTNQRGILKKLLVSFNRQLEGRRINDDYVSRIDYHDITLSIQDNYGLNYFTFIVTIGYILSVETNVHKELIRNLGDEWVGSSIGIELARNVIQHLRQIVEQNNRTTIYDLRSVIEYSPRLSRTQEIEHRYNNRIFVEENYYGTWQHGPESPPVRLRQVNEKAEALLLSCLNKKQRKQYKESMCFVVVGEATGTMYRINDYKQINIDILDKNGKKTGKRLCAVPNEFIPIEDQMLAQKLMLETDEMEFLSIAIEW